jgi:hypothetical protein
MHSLEGIVKLNSPKVSDQIHKNATALNLGPANTDAPKSSEKTGFPSRFGILWESLNPE